MAADSYLVASSPNYTPDEQSKISKPLPQENSFHESITYAVIGLDRLYLAFKGSSPLVVRGWVVKGCLGIRYVGDASVAHVDPDGRLGDFHSSLEFLAGKARKVLRCHCLGGLVRLRAELPLI